MRNILIAVFALVMVSCQSEEEKRLVRDIEDFKMKIVVAQDSLSNTCILMDSLKKEVLAKEVKTRDLDSVIRNLDSIKIMLSNQLNPQRSKKGSVVVFGKGRGANQSILNNKRFKFK